jgi:very-short-patch-repair endonuclease
MAPYIERAIAERAAQQLSHITREQLQEIGLSTARIRRMTKHGRLDRVGRRTYRLAGVVPTFEHEVMAACLDLGAVASGRTAAKLHGLDTERWEPFPVEVTVPKRTGQTSSELARVHTSTNLRPDDIILVQGCIPTTTLARTFFSLASLVPEIDAEDVRDLIDTASRDGRCSDKWLWWLLEQIRCRGRNGVTVLEDILEDRAGTGRTESWLERAFLSCLEEEGLPLPIVQRRIAPHGSFVARVDCLYEPNLVIEILGYRSHSTRRQTSKDADRRNRLRLAGYEILEFTYDRIVADPAGVCRDVRDALARLVDQRLP